EVFNLTLLDGRQWLIDVDQALDEVSVVTEDAPQLDTVHREHHRESAQLPETEEQAEEPPRLLTAQAVQVLGEKNHVQIRVSQRLACQPKTAGHGLRTAAAHREGERPSTERNCLDSYPLECPPCGSDVASEPRSCRPR